MKIHSWLPTDNESLVLAGEEIKRNINRGIEREIGSENIDKRGLNSIKNCLLGIPFHRGHSFRSDPKIGGVQLYCPVTMDRHTQWSGADAAP